MYSGDSKLSSPATTLTTSTRTSRERWSHSKSPGENPAEACREGSEPHEEMQRFERQEELVRGSYKCLGGCGSNHSCGGSAREAGGTYISVRL